MFLKLPGDRYVNLDALSEIYIKEITNPEIHFEIWAKSDGGIVVLYGHLSNQEMTIYERAVQVLDELMNTFTLATANQHGEMTVHSNRFD